MFIYQTCEISLPTIMFWFCTQGCLKTLSFFIIRHIPKCKRLYIVMTSFAAVRKILCLLLDFLQVFGLQGLKLLSITIDTKQLMQVAVLASIIAWRFCQDSSRWKSFCLLSVYLGRCFTKYINIIKMQKLTWKKAHSA